MITRTAGEQSPSLLNHDLYRVFNFKRCPANTRIYHAMVEWPFHNFSHEYRRFKFVYKLIKFTNLIGKLGECLNHYPRAPARLNLLWVKMTWSGWQMKKNENVRSESPVCRKWSHSSEMQNDALMHPEGWNGNKTRNICIAFVQCWPNVLDVALTLCKCYANVFCLLGI